MRPRARPSRQTWRGGGRIGAAGGGVVVGADHLYVGGNFPKVNVLPHPGFVQFAAAAS